MLVYYTCIDFPNKITKQHIKVDFCSKLSEANHDCESYVQGFSTSEEGADKTVIDIIEAKIKEYKNIIDLIKNTKSVFYKC